MAKTILAVLAIVFLAACTPTEPIGEAPRLPLTTNNEELARSFVENSPTYRHDGMDLRLAESYILESFPEQHVFIYEFTSRSAGYGDRSGMIAAQVLTEHTARVTVVQGVISSAKLDDKWDMIGQSMLPENPQPLPAGATTELEYRFMQCVELPWENIARDTLEAIKLYYASEHGITLLEVSQHTSEEDSCMACYECVSTTYYRAEVDSVDADAMTGLGWMAR
jgi:hypothetical protein